MQHVMPNNLQETAAVAAHRHRLVCSNTHNKHTPSNQSPSRHMSPLQPLPAAAQRGSPVWVASHSPVSLIPSAQPGSPCWTAGPSTSAHAPAAARPQSSAARSPWRWRSQPAAGAGMLLAVTNTPLFPSHQDAAAPLHAPSEPPETAVCILDNGTVSLTHGCTKCAW
jgi:hypothetical protein